MKIYNVTDREFDEYGRLVEGIDVKPILEALDEKTPVTDHVEYVPKENAIHNLPQAADIAKSLYGGMPAQFGWCNGHNTKLNCCEYHRDSEFNLGTDDFILLLAKLSQVKNGHIDSAMTKAFRVPAGVMVEVYADTLHYAPCHVDKEKGFRVLVVLPEGTNTKDIRIAGNASDDNLLWMTNKWLIAHKDTSEAAAGAFVGIDGANIDIAGDI